MEYKTLEIINDWTTRFELDGEEMDFGQYYDVLLPNDKEFRGCKVYAISHHHQGRGGMDESYTDIIGFFDNHDGIEARLKSGFRLRECPSRAIAVSEEEMQAIKQRSLGNLYAKREKLDREIQKFESREDAE